MEYFENGGLAVAQLLWSSPSQAKEVVPEGAFISNDKFWKCGKCGKVFWKGTHWNGIMERLNRLGLA